MNKFKIGDRVVAYETGNNPRYGVVAVVHHARYVTIQFDVDGFWGTFDDDDVEFDVLNELARL